MTTTTITAAELVSNAIDALDAPVRRIDGVLTIPMDITDDDNYDTYIPGDNDIVKVIGRATIADLNASIEGHRRLAEEALIEAARVTAYSRLLISVMESFGFTKAADALELLGYVDRSAALERLCEPA